MKRLTLWIPRLLAFGLFLSSVSSLSAQWLDYPTPGVPRTPDGKPNLNAACPRTADGKPDFSGLWEPVYNRPGAPPPPFEGCVPVSREFLNMGSSLKEGLPYQPWAAELVKKRRPEERLNDPLSHCLPAGLIRLHTYPLVKKIIQTPGLLVMLNELDASYRQIFTDGRPLPADPNPSWNGYSSGKWEGDTLVVQSSGFRDGMWIDASGSPMTDAAKITERYRRPDFGHLEIELTVDDPKAYTKPWTVKLDQAIKLDTDLIDSVCHENEKDMQHLK
jgi:hypothetical protein